jgi:signal peptidase I
VNESENWYEEANPDYVGSAENCKELSFYPAPHSGFITKGDANANYDQVRPLGNDAISSPVKPKRVTGTAQFRIPWLGKIRLILSQTAVTDQTDLVLVSHQAPLQTFFVANSELSSHS